MVNVEYVCFPNILKLVYLFEGIGAGAVRFSVVGLGGFRIVFVKDSEHWINQIIETFCRKHRALCTEIDLLI